MLFVFLFAMITLMLRADKYTFMNQTQDGDGVEGEHEVSLIVYRFFCKLLYAYVFICDDSYGS